MRSEDLQNIANNLPDSTNYKGVTQSYNPAKVRLKEWRYQQNPLHSTFKATGGCMAEVHQDSASHKQGYQGL